MGQEIDSERSKQPRQRRERIDSASALTRASSDRTSGITSIPSIGIGRPLWLRNAA